MQLIVIIEGSMRDSELAACDREAQVLSEPNRLLLALDRRLPTRRVVVHGE